MKKVIHLLCAICAAAFMFLAVSCNEPIPEIPEIDENTTWETARPLKEIYANNFLVGNIVGPASRDLGTNNQRFQILKRHFNTATAENAMKPNQLLRSNTENWNYYWTEADSIVKAVNDAGLTMHGHTLVWHSQSPAWLAKNGDSTQKDAALANLEKLVADVMNHFKGKVISWDVVNEAMRDGLGDPGNNWKDCLRVDGNNGSPWNQAIGPEYIEKAFLAARTADPEAQLYYNDYSLNDPNKAKAVYNMVKDINTRYPNVEGRPLIDGVGMQTHHHLGTSPQSVADSIALFADLGVEIAISEMDIRAYNVREADSAVWNDNTANEQARQYAAMFKVFKKYEKNISRVTFWGLDDAASWLNPPYTTGPCYATLLNRDLSLKPAFFAVLNNL